VWEHFTQPGLRPKWRAADEVRETSQSGRRGVGTVNHCMHGPHAIIEEVLDWRPFDYLTIFALLPMPDAPKVIMSYAFLEEKPGRRISRSGWRGRSPKDQGVSRSCRCGIPEDHHAESKSSGRCWKDRTGRRPQFEEPMLAGAAERFLTEPVHARWTYRPSVAMRRLLLHRPR